MRVAAIAWCTDIPGLQVYLFRRLSDDLAKNHMEGHTGFPALLAEWIEAGHVKINWSKNFIEFWNGSKIHLCHCQYEKDVTKYQGAQIGVLMIDELTHFTAKIYRYLRARCRLGGLKIPAKYQGMFPRVLCGSNPGGIGHNWVKASFIDDAPPLAIRKMPDDEGGMRRQYVPARLADNPSMAESDPDYAARLKGLGDPALVRAMEEGDWDIVAGGMFDDVWHRPTHVLEPFPIPASWRIDRSFDWGSSKPFSVGWWAESDGTEAVLHDGSKRTFPRGTLFRIGEWYGWNGRPNEGLKMSDSGIAAGIVQRQIEMGIADRVRPGPADSSIFDEINGDSPAKIQERHKVRWERADKSPGSRKRGWSLIRGRLKASKAERMEEPGLFVFETCRQFIRTVPVLPRLGRDPDDIDTDAEDHCFAAGTMVITEAGVAPIESLVGTTGAVLVDRGIWAPFENARLTRRSTAVVRVTFNDGSRVVCTPEHRFLSANGEWIEASKTTDVISYSAFPEEDAPCLPSSLFRRRFNSFSVSAITAAVATFSAKAFGYIGWCGSTRTALCRPVSMSTMSIMTAATTRSPIWNWRRRPTTCVTTQRSLATALKRWFTRLRPPSSGTEVMSAESGTRSSTPPTAPLGCNGKWARPAITAGTHTGQQLDHERRAVSAPALAGPRRGAHLALMSRTEPAQCAGRASRSTSIGRREPVPARAAGSLRVVAVEPFGFADVYCMTVPKWGRFALANGAVVHNCADEVRYRILAVKRTATAEPLRM